MVWGVYAVVVEYRPVAVWVEDVVVVEAFVLAFLGSSVGLGVGGGMGMVALVAVWGEAMVCLMVLLLLLLAGM